MVHYDIAKSYDWNYENAPQLTPEVDVPTCPGSWNFCGLPINSPLGIPAGPLLNSRWVLYYARLGFDVLTYKTVRSQYRRCYQPPNLVPVNAQPLSGDHDIVRDAPGQPSWAISFGMPSKSVSEWTKDVERARLGLAPRQILSVSVVASPEEGWRLDQIVADFVECAKLAKEAGAQAVEANLSCPNVCTQEGQLYTSPKASSAISAALAHTLAGVPLVLKIGLFSGTDQAWQFVEAVRPFANALSTTNSIAARVLNRDGSEGFDGLTRGIGGRCIRDRCNAEVQMLSSLLRTANAGIPLIGVGGVATASDVHERLAAGAHHVQIATAAMLDPLVAIQIRNEMSRATSAA